MAVYNFKKEIPTHWYFDDTTPFSSIKEVEKYTQNFVVIFPPAVVLEVCGFNKVDTAEDLIKLADWLEIPVTNKKFAHIQTELMWGLKRKLKEYKRSGTSVQFFTKQTMVLDIFDFCFMDDDTFPLFICEELVDTEMAFCGIDPSFLEILSKEQRLAVLYDALDVYTHIQDYFYNPDKDISIRPDWYYETSLLVGVNLKNGYEWKPSIL
jgi:hypothetical protein